MGIWTRKSIKELEANSEDARHKLRRTLTPFNLIMLGIGCIIGAGLFSITGIAAAENAGPAITVSFVIAALGCAFAGLCYSELAAMIPVAGSAYTYAYATMGELPAWVIGWTLILEYALGAAAVSISWSAYMVSFLQDFGIQLPTQIAASPWQSVALQDGTHVFGYINLLAFLIVAIISTILIIGIQQSAIINSVMVAIKVSVVLLFIGFGFFYINYDNYHPFLPSNTGNFGEFGWSGVMRAAGVVFFAYIGFDAVSTAAQEAKAPQKSMPIGILGSLAICAVLYILFSFVMTGLVNYKELNVAAPAALAIEHTPLNWLQGLIKIAIIAGLTSVILVMLLGQSRVFYSMSRDGLLPEMFSRIHPTFQTPWISTLVLMVFVGLIGAFCSLELVGHMTSIGTLMAFVMVCLGVLILRYRQPWIPRPFKTPWVPFVPIMGILVCLAMMFSLGYESWLRLLVWMGIGLIFYFYYGRYHR